MFDSGPSGFSRRYSRVRNYKQHRLLAEHPDGGVCIFFQLMLSVVNV